MRKTIIIFFLILLFIGLIGFFLVDRLNWAVRAVEELPNETALDRTYDYNGNVIIVGAGASGLAAAKILEQNNIDYLILEATNRYGGRLKKDTTLADFPIDIGAEWIHSAPIVLNKLKGKKGEKIDEEIIPYHLEESYDWDGKKLREVSKIWLDLFYHFIPESKFKNSTWYDYVNDNIAKDVRHKIKFNAVVSEVDYSQNNVVVKTTNDSIYTADRVLITVSLGVLKSGKIKFIPKMNQDKRKAIEAVTFHPGFKVAMKFTEKFYPDAINCETKTGEKTFYDMAFKKNTNDNILGFLSTGSSVEKYYKLTSKEEILSAILNELDQMYEGKASEAFTGKYIMENWGQYEFTQGTWTQAFEEDEANLEILRQPLKDKVYFAGEVYDTYRQMGVPGAILSGYHSIDELLTSED